MEIKDTIKHSLLSESKCDTNRNYIKLKKKFLQALLDSQYNDSFFDFI